jgi:hypothetical protein
MRDDGDFDFVAVAVAVEAVIELLPDLVDCGEVFLVSSIGFRLLGAPVFLG